MYAALIRQVAYLPLRECRINDDWKESRMASISFARDRPDGRVAIAAFCVDLGCLGVKSAFANPAMSVAEYESGLVRNQPTCQIRCDSAFAVKLIQGAHDYARQLGFSPDPGYHYAREIFGGIDPACWPETIEYGEDGKPFYVNGPHDDVETIMNHLIRKLGPDGFHYLFLFGAAQEFDLLNDEDEDQEGTPFVDLRQFG